MQHVHQGAADTLPSEVRPVAGGEEEEEKDPWWVGGLMDIYGWARALPFLASTTKWPVHAQACTYSGTLPH